MVEVHKTGMDLVRSVQQADCAAGHGWFWWMGQHSFILKLGGRTALIDPFLAGHPDRRTPPLLTPAEAAFADFCLVTHDHLDHLDPYAVAGIAAQGTQTRFVVPRPHRRRALDLGIPEDRLITLGHLETVDIDGWEVTGVKARHEFFHESLEGFPFLGFVVSADGVTIYHSGDTLAWDGLRGVLQRWSLDAAFLPINGRDAERYLAGCLGNMSYQEAVELAGDLGVKLAVPTHYDMFAGNSEDPKRFAAFLAAKYPEVPCWIGPAGLPVRIGPG